MAREQLKTLTEPMYYLLLALTKSQHGYSIMQSIQEISNGRVKVGAGTLYALLSRFEAEDIIEQIAAQDRKKIYALTEKGRQILSIEYMRLQSMTEDGRRFFDNTGAVLPSKPSDDESLLIEEALFPKETSEASRPSVRRQGEKEKREKRQPQLNRKGVLV